MLDRPRLLAILAAQTEVVRDGLDSQQATSVLVELAAALTGADGASLERPLGPFMIQAAAVGLAAEHPGTRIPLAGSLSGLCAQERRTLRCDDAWDDARVTIGLCRQLGIRSMLCAPVVVDGTAVGVLKALSERSGGFDDCDAQALELVADVIAALWSGHERRQAARRENRLDALTGLGAARAFEERLGVEVDRAERYERPLTVCLFEADGLGDPAAPGVERVVLAIAGAMGSLRRADDAFRIGPGRFAVLMPETDSRDAVHMASRVAARVAEDAGASGVRLDWGAAEAVGSSTATLAAAQAALDASRQRRLSRTGDADVLLSR